MKCWVKSRNERTPSPYLPARNGGNSRETAGDNPEQGGDDVKSSGACGVGLHRCCNGGYGGLESREVELISQSSS